MREILRIGAFAAALAFASVTTAYADDVDVAVRALSDSDAGRRRQAARDLARLGPDAETAAPELNRLVGDVKERPDVRIEAFHALRRIGVDLAPAVSSLTDLLGHAEARVRSSAAAAFGVAADRAVSAAPALAKALADRDGDVRYAAVVALGRVGGGGRAAMPALLARVNDEREDGKIRDASREALSAMWGLSETARATALSALVLLTSTQPADRDAAVRAFGGLGTDAISAIPALVSMLRSQDAGSRAAAADALGAVGSLATSAAADLEQAMHDADADVAAHATAALAAVRGVAPGASTDPGTSPGGVAVAFDERAWRAHEDRGSDAIDSEDYAAADHELAVALDLLTRSGMDDMRLAETLFHLGLLRNGQRRWSDGEAFLRKSLAIRERFRRTASTQTGWAFNDLADALKAEDRNVEAEAMARQALLIFERHDPPIPDAVAFVCNHIGSILSNQRRYEEARQFITRALDSWRRLHGENHKDVGRALNNLAGVLRSLKFYAESERAYRAAARVWTTVLGKNHRWTYMPYHNLGLLYEELKRWSDAETALRTALDVARAAGVAPGDQADTLGVLARVLRAVGREDEAKACEVEAKRLRGGG